MSVEHSSLHTHAVLMRGSAKASENTCVDRVSAQALMSVGLHASNIYVQGRATVHNNSIHVC